MPRIKMRTRIAGEIIAFPGDEIEVSKEQAEELISGGYAEGLDAPKAPAAKPKTSKPKAKKGRRQRTSGPTRGRITQWDSRKLHLPQ